MRPNHKFCARAQSNPCNLFPDMKKQFFIACYTLCSLALFAQDQTPINDTVANASGSWALVEIVGIDTTYLLSLPPVRIKGPRKFKDREEQNLYYRYSRAAAKVYPYAVKAVEMYEDIQAETAGMSKRKKRKHLRNEHNELKEDFTDEMKNLSKTQGKVLIKMIERQVGKPFYEIIQNTRGTSTAVYWNTLGKMWGYDLKNGYYKGEDPFLDEIFIDYDFGEAIWRNQ
jgi:Domain of unknown function (DUF4294)